MTFWYIYISDNHLILNQNFNFWLTKSFKLQVSQIILQIKILNIKKFFTLNKSRPISNRLIISPFFYIIKYFLYIYFHFVYFSFSSNYFYESKNPSKPPYPAVCSVAARYFYFSKTFQNYICKFLNIYNSPFSKFFITKFLFIFYINSPYPQ